MCLYAWFKDLPALCSERTEIPCRHARQRSRIACMASYGLRAIDVAHGILEEHHHNSLRDPDGHGGELSQRPTTVSPMQHLPSQQRAPTAVPLHDDTHYHNYKPLGIRDRDRHRDRDRDRERERERVKDHKRDRYRDRTRRHRSLDHAGRDAYVHHRFAPEEPVDTFPHVDAARYPTKMVSSEPIRSTALARTAMAKHDSTDETMTETDTDTEMTAAATATGIAEGAVMMIGDALEEERIPKPRTNGTGQTTGLQDGDGLVQLSLPVMMDWLRAPQESFHP